MFVVCLMLRSEQCVDFARVSVGRKITFLSSQYGQIDGNARESRRARLRVRNIVNTVRRSSRAAALSLIKSIVARRLISLVGAMLVVV